MAVNLTGIDLSGAAIGSTPKAKSGQASASSSQDTGAQHSEVSITSTAVLLARLQQSLGNQPPVDQNRVDTISKALAAGTYHVNADKVAHGLQQFSRVLSPLPLKEI